MKTLQKKELYWEGQRIIKGLKRNFRNNLDYVPLDNVERSDSFCSTLEPYGTLYDKYHLTIAKKDEFFDVKIKQVGDIANYKIGYYIEFSTRIRPGDEETDEDSLAINKKNKLTLGKLFFLPARDPLGSSFLPGIDIPEIEGGTGYRKGNQYTRSYTLLIPKKERPKETVDKAINEITFFINSIYRHINSKFNIQERPRQIMLREILEREESPSKLETKTIKAEASTNPQGELFQSFT